MNRRPAEDPVALAAAVKDGDKRAIARSITLVENEEQRAIPLIDALHKSGGQAFVIGITGPPGAGKSTLVASLVKEIRRGERRVGIIAVDPTSPFSGGALLGDRVRMDRVASDPGVFIRSMATRGSLGGLSRKTVDAVIVLDAAGYDIVIVETVGVGQSEVEIARTADTTVVVLSPEAGDGIQAMKAGLMEIAQVYCVNKADREGADRLIREIQLAKTLATPADGWATPVVKTVARSGQGVADLLAAIESHREYQKSSGTLGDARLANARRRITGIATDQMNSELLAGRDAVLERLSRAVVERSKTPYAAARELISAYLSESREPQ